MKADYIKKEKIELKDSKLLNLVFKYCAGIFFKEIRNVKIANLY